MCIWMYVIVWCPVTKFLDDLYHKIHFNKNREQQNIETSHCLINLLSIYCFHGSKMKNQEKGYIHINNVT